MSYSAKYQTFPMSADLFKGYDVKTIHREFFEDDLIDNADEDGCCYFAFTTQTLDLDEEIKFVLFQFDSKIVACGLLIDIDHFEEMDEEGFIGAYVFNASSIVTFSPVGLEEFKSVYPGIKKLGVQPQLLDEKRFGQFVDFLRPRLLNIASEDFTPQAWIKDQLEAIEVAQTEE
ncbi:MAG: hypothetical protein RL318_2002 [Fibrobacterota bacterium]|jgi:hypothetical protein